MKSYAFLLGAAIGIAADLKVIAPAGGRAPVGPYSPGIMAGNFLYVSGQGARDAQSNLAPTFAEQTEQCLRNVQAIVEGAGLKMADIVYAQVYVADLTFYDKLNEVWLKWFPSAGPVRAVLGVTRMPTDTPVEITVVAARPELPRRVFGQKQAPGAITVGGRTYLAGVLGRRSDTNRIPEPKEQVKLAFDGAEAVLKSAKTGFGDVLLLNVYISGPVTHAMVEDELPGGVGKAPRAIVQTSALPLKTNVEVTGVFANEPGTMSVVGATSGTTEQVLSSIKTELEKRGLSMANVVASNVYIDDIDNFATMNKTYASFFGEKPPTRTTVQPTPPAAGKQNIISVIAEK